MEAGPIDSLGFSNAIVLPCRKFELTKSPHVLSFRTDDFTVNLGLPSVIARLVFGNEPTGLVS